MRLVSIDPPELGRRDGLAYALFVPEGEPRGGVVVVHGADSSKESHFEFAREARAAGLAVVCFDQRGHGDSGGVLDDRAVFDVATVSALLPDGVPVALRGSSLGGWLALAATELVRPAAVVALCPATSAGLLEGLRTGRFSFRADRAALAREIAEHDLEAAARGLTERLLLMHAEGDEVVPVAHSQWLHSVAPGSRLVVVPGGHHRTVQHDTELQAFSVRWIVSALGG